MSLALAIALIVIFDVALLAMLAFVMAQPRRLRPHVGHAPRNPQELRPSSEREQAQRWDLAA